MKKQEEIEELFDSRVRDLLDSCQEVPSEDVWNGIERKLDRQRGHVVWRTAARFCAAAAVVAGLFMTVFLLNDEGETVAPGLVAVVEKSEAVPVQRTQELPLNSIPGVRADVRTLPGADPVTETAMARVLKAQKPKRDEAYVAEKRKADTVSGIPSIYDRAAMTGYIAMAADQNEYPDRRRSGSFSVSASGNLATTRATGNVEFAQPSYNWGSAGTQSQATGIVPVSDPRHYFPVSVGLDLKYSFLKDRLGVGIGVNYTFLNSRYEALVDNQYQASVDQSVHYLGVPLSFYVNILSSERLSFYASAGCMMEKAVKVSYDITDLHSVTYKQEREADGVQWSANVGLGMEYRFMDFMGVYVDPRLTYFFDCGQPYSVRAEQPLQFNLEMGFRFHIGA